MYTGKDFWVLGACLSLCHDAESFVFDAHLLQKGRHIHTGASPEGGEQKLFGSGSLLLTAKLGGCVHDNMMAVGISIKGHL